MNHLETFDYFVIEMKKIEAKYLGMKSSDKLILNPLLGARNRAIRGESTIICEKP
ncbi:hypothetical protein H5T88_04865 [bacterium]|nr:hypothetical protein [bacterium]